MFLGLMKAIRMKILKILVSLLFIFNHGVYIAQEAPNNYLSFENREALHRFYQQDSKWVTPLVQGHRGTIENDLPENSIAAFEYVLRRMPAVFEIDPRLTKDSIIVVFHDATLERTTNGSGRLADHTWEELQQLNLKNVAGELTEYKIPSLAEVLEWARGKTVLILDKKDVPLPMIADIIRKHKANGYVINLVRSVEDALFYYQDEPKRMFTISIRTPEAYQAYIKAGIPKTQVFASLGTKLKEKTISLCRHLQGEGIRCLLAVGSTYDKLPTRQQRAEAYRKIVEAGFDIIESDYPIEVQEAINATREK